MTITDPAAFILAMAVFPRPILTAIGGPEAAAEGVPYAIALFGAGAIPAWLANTLGKFDIPFRKGEIILSGALAPLVPVQPGDEVSLTLSGLGSARLRFVS